MTTYEILDHDGAVIADGFDKQKVIAKAQAWITDIIDHPVNAVETYVMMIDDVETAIDIPLIIEADSYDAGRFDYYNSRGC